MNAAKGPGAAAVDVLDDWMHGQRTHLPAAAPENQEELVLRQP
jgi:hypothetical protein